MAAGTKNDDTLITEINMTPLVDVMLVLLVIFMIAAPSLYHGNIKLELPKAATGDRTDKVTMNFKLLKDGRVFLDKREITRAEVAQHVQTALQLDAKADAMVAADRALTHGEVMQFVDELKAGGIQKMAVAVDGVNGK
jgi:biopolymer transport protein ExbD